MADILSSIHAAIDTVRDALTTKRVFGDPIDHDGTLIIPVATIIGTGGLGGGSGSGHGPDEDSDAGTAMGGEGAGGGSGFGLRVRPLGVYRVEGDSVTWHPSIDINRAIIGGQVVGAVALIATACIVRTVIKFRR